MSNNAGREIYVFTVGGTGARVGEAFVHLVASGLLNEGRNTKITMVPIDADMANKNVSRLTELVNDYEEVYESFENELSDLRRDPSKGNAAGVLENRSIFNVEMRIKGPVILQSDGGNNLSAIFGNNELLKALYPKSARDMHLGIGFRGRPAIGVPPTYDQLGKHEVMKAIKQDIRNQIAAGKLVQAIVMGSAIGGTGASLLPVIPKIFEGMDGIRWTGIVMLPYFGWKTDRCPNRNGPLADWETFDDKVLFILDYYNISKIYNSLYYIGYPYKFIFKNCSPGGRRQSNPVTVIDLAGAISAVRDIVNTPKLNQHHEHYMIVNLDEKQNERLIKLSSLNLSDRSMPPPITYLNLFLFWLLYLKVWFSPSGPNRALPSLPFTIESDGCINGNDGILNYSWHFIRFLKEVNSTTANEGAANNALTHKALVSILRDAFEQFVNLWNNTDTLQKNYEKHVLFKELNSMVVNMVEGYRIRENRPLSCHEFAVASHSALMKAAAELYWFIKRNRGKILVDADALTEDIVKNLIIGVLQAVINIILGGLS